MLGDFAVQGDWRHAWLFSAMQESYLICPDFMGTSVFQPLWGQMRKWLCTYVNSRNPTLAQERWARLAVVAHRKYRNEAAGLQSWGTGNLISPAPGMPKSLFNIFCFYPSKPPRGRIAHKHLYSIIWKKKKKILHGVIWRTNLEFLFWPVKMRAMEGTSDILDIKKARRNYYLLSITKISAGRKRINSKI